ncbi:MAG: glycosyltransferase [Myxococcota bacterium]
MLKLIIQILLAVVFANRYIIGTLLMWAKGKEFDKVLSESTDWQPGVTITIPMYNEGEGIFRTVKSLLEQEYPKELLKIIVVDDCSTDDSYAWAKRAEELAPDRVTVMQNAENMGKRRGLIRAVRRADTEIIVSVDSDVVVAKDAIAQLMRRFTRPEIAAVGGRVHVLNKHENWLTRMQTIKYFFGYEYLKNVERYFSTVMCLSGCLTAYRREVLLELEPILEDRNLYGIPIKYGEDRFLTRQIVKKGYGTVLTMDAVCHTIAPNTLAKYFSQQLRWRRSIIVDYMGGITHVWRLHPLVCLHYFAIFALIMAYPALVVESIFVGALWETMFIHLGIVTLLGAIYSLQMKNIPEEDQVSPLNFMAMVLVMPVVYMILTPLALFTLGTGSWETRGTPKAEEAAEPVRQPEPVLAPAAPMASPTSARTAHLGAANINSVAARSVEAPFGSLDKAEAQL